MALDTDITVNVYQTAQGVARANLTNICLLSTGATHTGTLVEQYTSPAAVSADAELDAATILAAGFFFAQPNHPEVLRIAKITAYNAFETELPAILAADPEIRAVCTLDRTKANLIELAATCATHGILCAIQSKDADILTNVAANLFVTIKALTNDFCVCIWHDDNAMALDLGALASGLGGGGPDVRSFPWAGMTIVGVDASQGAATVLTSTEKTAIEAAGGNWYDTLSGITMLKPGKLTSGRFADERITASWAGFRVYEAIMQAFANAASQKRKLPFNAAGIAEIDAIAKRTLGLGAPPVMDSSVAHFNPGSIGSRPPLEEEITAAQKALRTLPAFSVWAIKAGAAGKVTINVYLS